MSGARRRKSHDEQRQGEVLEEGRGLYSHAMEAYLSAFDMPDIRIDVDRLIAETEAEVWAMVDRYRQESD